MELYACMQAAVLCPAYSHLFIYTDSKLCIGWLSQGMGMRSRQLIAIAKAYFVTVEEKHLVVTFKHVKGHMATDDNLRADRAARAQSRKAQSAVLSRTERS